SPTNDSQYQLPIPTHPALLPDLIVGLDRCLQYYTRKAKSGCGSRNTFIPAMLALTRCAAETKFHGVFRKKEKPANLRRRNSQVFEYDAPVKLLEDEGSAFSKMVQSTGAENAQYFRNLAFGAEGDRIEKSAMDGQRRWLTSSRWAAAAQFALAANLTSSSNDLVNMGIKDDNNSILKKTKDAVVTLQSVLKEEHDKDIDESLV
ncbi:ABC transporter C family member 2-like protein, partial [Tanacetum coccineum]